jgi:hypothetical protein
MPTTLTVGDRRVFIRKLVVLFTATILLAPLIVYKLMLPAYLYVGGLIGLHLVVFAVYLYRTPWRELWRDKAGFVLRLVAVVFFIYLLTLLHFEGDAAAVLIQIAVAFVLHAGIICGLHLRRAAA